MHLPFQKIHDSLWSYGRLLIPWFGKDRWGNRRWIAFFNKIRPMYIRIDSKFFISPIIIRRTDINGFHNCTKTGIH